MARSGSSLDAIDAPYRRGLVLGLTLAELFLLLVFVLLLAQLLLYKSEVGQRPEGEKPIQAPSEDVTEAEGATGEEMAERLAKAERKAADAERKAEALAEPAELGRSLERLAEKLGKAVPEILTEMRRAPGVARENQNLRAELSNAEKAAAARNQEVERLKDELSEAKERVTELESQLGTQSRGEAAAERALAEVTKELRQLQRNYAEARAALAGTIAGIDPSCWHRQEDRESDARPSVVFLFDVAVFPGHLVIRDREDVPKYYGDEKKGLPLGQVQFNKMLSDEQFLQQTADIERMARSGEIRDYPCVFHVLVFDQLPAQGGRERWKTATEGVIGERFYRLTARSPWEGVE